MILSSTKTPSVSSRRRKPGKRTATLLVGSRAVRRGRGSDGSIIVITGAKISLWGICCQDPSLVLLNEFGKIKLKGAAVTPIQMDWAIGIEAHNRIQVFF
mmetsp:Transcript_9518/g.20198  ORF Transcript_9518/g.20198 Transcript_9518/m.20198 type:complete len:100 (-) Transcript_9518:1943-2242(-)